MITSEILNSLFSFVLFFVSGALVSVMAKVKIFNFLHLCRRIPWFENGCFNRETEIIFIDSGLEGSTLEMLQFLTIKK